MPNARNWKVNGGGFSVREQSITRALGAGREVTWQTLVLQSERVKGICREPCGPSRWGCLGNGQRFGTAGVVSICRGGSGEGIGGADQVLEVE